VSLSHYDRCFGCGPANPSGLQLKLERRADGSVAGGFRVKQEHQGPPGTAHGGVVAAALDEAMSLLIHTEGTLALTAHLEIDLHAPAAVGSFVELEARVERREARSIHTAAAAHGEEEGGERRRLAEASAVFVRVEPPSTTPGERSRS
jgi:acyl-coenzyme A thioesterase PaaI-like protein